VIPGAEQTSNPQKSSGKGWEVKILKGGKGTTKKKRDCADTKREKLGWVGPTGKGGVVRVGSHQKRTWGSPGHKKKNAKMGKSLG